MSKWNPLALKLLMWVIGALLVMGSGLGFIGGSFFPFDSWAGVTASVAGVAFGAGVMIAGFDPENNVSWVRALILYAILEVVWQIFDQITLAHFDVVAFIIAVLVGVLLLVLYPNKSELLMNAGAKGGSGAMASGAKARA
ncbi:MAG TPA: hypothetical protein VFB69_01800 [Candidatus Dormibacteraeota bacterium]|nr:hypothetical protein [Candidatus Dormibacteraeota bacterium]